MLKSVDIPRYVLLAVIAASLYLLLGEWVKFKEQPSVTTPTFTSSQTQGLTSNDVSINKTLTPNNADTLIPSTENIPSSVEAPSEARPEIATNTKTIEVTTDVLHLKIDLLGGDIVYAALPKHFAKLETPDEPFVVLENNNSRVYIAQSGLIGKNGTDSSEGRPQYTTATHSYSLADDQDSLTVELQFQQTENILVKKLFTFSRNNYLVQVDYRIENASTAAWSASLFAQIKRDNSADPAVESSGLGMAPFLGAAYHSNDESFKKASFKNIAKKPLNENYTGGWIAMIQHYFVSAWIPNAEQTHKVSTLKTASGDNLIRFTSPTTTVAPNSQGSIQSQFYVGPKDQYALEEISEGLELSVDYGWLWWIAQPLFWLLTKIHSLVGNWGWSIILVTVLVKALFFQLNATAYRSMANMRKLQPKIVDLRERYANDKQKQSQEMMALYKKEKINPLGGCLPILVQMPVFIALYWVLLESVELRHAPFIAWIKDLSVMDPYFVLPLVMGASMFFQQKLNPPPPDPMQAKVMQWMPVIFTFFFLFFPAGLVLYWVVNNLLSIAQQYVITKKIEKSTAKT